MISRDEHRSNDSSRMKNEERLRDKRKLTEETEKELKRIFPFVQLISLCYVISLHFLGYSHRFTLLQRDLSLSVFSVK